MMPSPFQFQCPQTGTKFMQRTTCDLRIDRAAAPRKPTTVPLTAVEYDRCRDCRGPVRIGEGGEAPGKEELPQKFRAKPKVAVIVERPARVKRVSEPKKRLKAAPGKAADISVLKDRRTLQERFLDTPSGGIWTGTTCGCVKPKEAFYEPHRCRECRNKRARITGPYKGHYLHLVRIMAIRFYAPSEGETTRSLLAALRNEANGLKRRSGMGFQIVTVGKRVRVRRVK